MRNAIPHYLLLLSERIDCRKTDICRKRRLYGNFFSGYETKQITTLVVGDLNVTTWRKDSDQWVIANELWQTSDLSVPTYRKGTAPDVVGTTPGNVLPEDSPSLDLLAQREQDFLGYFPAYVSGKPILGDRVASFLSFQTIWPEVEGATRKYNVADFSVGLWTRRNTILFQIMREQTEERKGRGR